MSAHKKQHLITDPADHSTAGLTALQLLRVNAAGTAIESSGITNPTVISGLIQDYLTKSNLAGDNIVNSAIIETSGKVGINESVPASAFHLKGIGNTSATITALIENNLSNIIVKVTDDRKVSINNSSIISSSISGEAILVDDGISFNQSNGGGYSHIRLYNQGVIGAQLAYTNSSEEFGIYNGSATGELRIYSNNVNRMKLSASGDFSFGYGGFGFGGNTKIRIIGEDISSSKYALKIVANDSNTTITPILNVRNDGQIEMGSVTGALILPRLTTTQRNVLTATEGMLIYNTTLAKLQIYTTAWETITSI